MSLDDRIDAVAAAPKGRHVAAFFDYDGTVIGGYSAAAFYRKRVRDGEIGPAELASTLWSGLAGISSATEFDQLLARSLQAWEGKTEQELTELGEKLFREEIAARLHTEIWQLAAAHRERGHTIVLASSATRFQTAPMATDLGADHVICTEVETREDGVLTGKAAGRGVWGINKARAVRALAGERGIDLAESFGYSDGDEDVPFLDTVGKPVAVEPGHRLAREAERRSWPVLRCTQWGRDPGMGDLVRTAGFYGSFLAAFGTGLGVGLLNGSRRQTFEITGGLGADLGLAVAGIEVNAIGTEHLWSARPCVFVFNHQSLIDPVLVMKLLRWGFTGVAKKEAKRMPLFGQLFQIADVAFVDRGNTEQAKQALAPAVAKVRDQGTSLVMAPEGTRSATPKLGRFKKGAFHIAMQAGVPIVPIVIRNAGEVMWRGQQSVRPGTVDIAVRPPVSTDSWSAETVDEHAREVREIFERTLARWPGEDQ